MKPVKDQQRNHKDEVTNIHEDHKHFNGFNQGVEDVKNILKRSEKSVGLEVRFIEYILQQGMQAVLVILYKRLLVV
jgi:hypothetical protein